MFTKKFPWFKKKEAPVAAQEKFLTPDVDFAAMEAQAVSGEKIDQELLKKARVARKMKEEEAVKILDILGIPHDASFCPTTVTALDLVKILMDDKKLKTINAKLRMKAFW